MKNKLKLPEIWSKILLNLPENGMGYQLVNITFNDLTLLNKRMILNSDILVLEEDETINIENIINIELYK